MAAVHAPIPPTRRPDLGFREFVTMIAALMAMAALSIDVMLPALPAIGDSLGVTNPNDRQWVVSAFVLGLGSAQILHGPLSDRFGRRPVLLTGLFFGVVFNLLAAISASFTLLLIARAASGVAIATTRVLAVSIVRDRFAGDAMARVMSLVTIVFMIVPIAAPNLGQLILLVAPWRWIFHVLTTAGLLLFIWTAMRLPETLAADDRLPLSFGRIGQAFRFVLTDRLALGYTVASTMLQGGIMGFILSVQQVFEVEFGAPQLLGPVFAGVAGTMALAALLNARIVMRYGARAVSHRAMMGFTAIAAVHLAVALTNWETLYSFALLQALMMSCFGLAASNFNAIAMEHMGKIAGTASSVQGSIQVVGGGLIGVVMGASFNGTTVPLYAGFTGCGLVTILAVLAAERGRLFGKG